MVVTKTSLRSFMRKYFTIYMEKFHKESRKDSFILNSSLNFMKNLCENDFRECSKNQDEEVFQKEYDEFFESVFKDKIKLIKC